jgi:hypothetical protein
MTYKCASETAANPNAKAAAQISYVLKSSRDALGRVAVKTPTFRRASGFFSATLGIGGDSRFRWLRQKSNRDVQVECHVIKSQLSYDSILASLRPKGSTETNAVVQDEIKTVYVPELNQHADVVFTRGQMYIAQGFAQQRI